MYRSALLFALCLACEPPADTGDANDTDACSEPAVVGFDDVPPIAEGMTWEEDGVTLTLLASGQGDFNARHDADTGCLWLYIGTTLHAEPSCPSSAAEIDTIDYCGGGCAQAAAFEGSVEVDTATSAPGMDPQTLELSADAFDLVEIVGLETPVCEIRLDP